MESTPLSDTAQANTRSNTQQPNLTIMQKIIILSACIKTERNRLLYELFIGLAIKAQEERFEDDDPEDEGDEDNEEDMEDEEDEDLEDDNDEIWEGEWIPSEDLDPDDEEEDN